MFILSPGEDDSATRGEVAGAAALICSLNVLMGWLVIPLVLGAVPVAVSSSARFVTAILLIQALMLIAMLAFRWALSTYVAWSVGAMSGGASHLLPYAAAVIMADAVLVVREVMVLVIVWIRRDAITAGYEMPRIGLNLFVEASSPVLNGLLNDVNFFTAWHAIVLGIGLRTLAGVSRRASIVIVLVLWTVLLLISLATAPLRS